jgi:hypothetical protein
MAPRKPELSEDDAQIVAGGGEDRVHGIAGAAIQVISPHQAIMFGVSDDGFDGVSALERAAQCPGEATFLAGNVHADVFDPVAAVTAVDKAAQYFRTARSRSAPLRECSLSAFGLRTPSPARHQGLMFVRDLPAERGTRPRARCPSGRRTPTSSSTCSSSAPPTAS